MADRNVCHAHSNFHEGVKVVAVEVVCNSSRAGVSFSVAMDNSNPGSFEKFTGHR